MIDSTHVVILAGGKGQRLWPLSRPGCYKPFLPLLGQRSLLDATLERALSLVAPDHIHLVGTREMVRDVGPFSWIEEPEARNTAPAIYHAARTIDKMDPAATLLVFPADHLVIDADAFRRGLRDTLDDLESSPDRFWLHGTAADADSSFGFIVPENPGKDGDVAKFVEKPDPESALSLTAEGAIRNTGIFCFKAKLLIREFDRIIADSCGADSIKTADVPAVSIDHFLLDRFDFRPQLQVRQMTHRWSDLGTWSSLRDLFPADPLGNIVIQDVLTPASSQPIDAGDAVMIRCQDATIESDGSLQVVALGLNQLDIDVSAEGVTIGPRGVSAEVGISGCHNLIVYKQGDLRLSVHGFSDGVVAMTHDIVFVCSELELASGAISEALMLLSNRSKGDN